MFTVSQVSGKLLLLPNNHCSLTNWHLVNGLKNIQVNTEQSEKAGFVYKSVFNF